MFIVKVLKRKDAASVLLAIVVAMIVGQFITSIVTPVAVKISALSKSQGFGPAGDWKVQYLLPVVTAVLALIALEIVVRLYVYIAAAVTRK